MPLVVGLAKLGIKVKIDLLSDIFPLFVNRFGPVGWDDDEGVEEDDVDELLAIVLSYNAMLSRNASLIL